MFTIEKLIFEARFPSYMFEEVIDKFVGEEWKEKIGLDSFVKIRY
jgi:hypothetical protein